MAHFLSRLHADLRETLSTRRGATHRPEDVPRFIHKEYSRMPFISLPEPTDLKATLAEALNKRHSTLSNNPATPLSLEEYGTLLGLALRKRPNAGTRNYPSGGALYPIETYLISSAFQGEAPAVFHYNPTKHGLEKLWNLPGDFNVNDAVRHHEPLQCSALIIFTSVWQRSAAKYGDFCYTLALLEAGHMSENILLVAEALSLSANPMAGFNDSLVMRWLDLDEGYEQPVHSTMLSK